MARPVRVVLAEDHTLLRALLRSSLSGRPDLEVVGEAATGPEAVRLVRAVRPDVLVLDVELNGAVDGVQVAERVAGRGCRVLAHSSHSDPVHVAHLLRAGASGYLSKEAPVGRIGDAIRAVAAGESRWFESGMDVSAQLSPDEQAALEHLAEGGRPDTIGAALGTSTERGLDVLARLYAALDASSWYEALAVGWGQGLVSAGRTPRPRYGRPSIRVNVPGHASSASVGSYGA